MLKRTLTMVAALAVSVIAIGLATPAKAVCTPAVGAYLTFQEDGTQYSLYVRAYVSNGKPQGIVVVYDGKSNIGGNCSSIQVPNSSSAIVSANVSVKGKPAVLRISLSKTSAGPQAGFQIIQDGGIIADAGMATAKGMLSICR